MTFTQACVATPTEIRTISVTLITKPEGSDGPEIQAASYQVEIYDQNGVPMHVQGDSGDLVPHLSEGDGAWLIDFMARLRTKAAEEFLP